MLLRCQHLWSMEADIISSVDITESYDAPSSLILPPMQWFHCNASLSLMSCSTVLGHPPGPMIMGQGHTGVQATSPVLYSYINIYININTAFPRKAIFNIWNNIIYIYIIYISPQHMCNNTMVSSPRLF